MLGREGELEPLRVKSQVRLCLFGYVGGVVVEQHANLGLGGILGIEFPQQSDEVRAGMAITDDLRNPARMQVQASQ